jgi:hypothetical protein
VGQPVEEDEPHMVMGTCSLFLEEEDDEDEEVMEECEEEESSPSLSGELSPI